jgi:hypothetical protein
MPFIGLDSLRAGVALVAIALLATGCGSLHGPSLDVTAPRLVGRAVDARTAQPVGPTAWKIPTRAQVLEAQPLRPTRPARPRWDFY